MVLKGVVSSACQRAVKTSHYGAKCFHPPIRAVSRILLATSPSAVSCRNLWRRERCPIGWVTGFAHQWRVLFRPVTRAGRCRRRGFLARATSLSCPLPSRPALARPLPACPRGTCFSTPTVAAGTAPCPRLRGACAAPLASKSVARSPEGHGLRGNCASSCCRLLQGRQSRSDFRTSCSGNLP